MNSLNAPTPWKRDILLFDFDGTLVLTEEIAQTALKNYLTAACASLGSSQVDRLASMIIGRTWRAAAIELSKALEAEHILVDQTAMVKSWKEGYAQGIAKSVPLIPGVMDALQQLKQRVSYMGIVTGSDRDEVEIIMKKTGISGLFDRMWTSGDYEGSKPSPAPYLQALSDLKADPSRVIVFEDSEAGVASSHAAGLPWVQVAYSSYVKRDPRSRQIIHDWTELNWQVFGY